MACSRAAASPGSRPRRTKKRIVSTLIADRGEGAMAGNHLGVVGERHQPRTQRSKDEVGVAAPEIGAPYATPKKRIAGEGHRVRAAPQHERDAARRMSRRMQDLELDAPRAHHAFMHEVA